MPVPRKLRFTQLSVVAERTGRTAREIAAACLAKDVQLYVEGKDWQVAWGVDPLGASSLPCTVSTWSGRAVAVFPPADRTAGLRRSKVVLQAIIDDSREESLGTLFGEARIKQPPVLAADATGSLAARKPRSVKRLVPRGRNVRIQDLYARDVDLKRVPLAIPDVDEASETKYETTLRLLGVVLLMGATPDAAATLEVELAPSPDRNFKTLRIRDMTKLSKDIQTFVEEHDIAPKGLRDENTRKVLAAAAAAFSRYEQKR